MGSTNKAAAVVGCGGIFPLHARSLQKLEVPLKAVCDIVPARAEKAAAEYGCKAYADIGAMLNEGGFQVLHICLPHYLHAPIAIDALERGFHVLSEKPMATNATDARRMILSAEAQGKSLGIIFQNRYNPGSVLVKKRLLDGSLGKVTGGRLRVTWHRDGAYYTESGWRGKWATEGGGALINQSIHTFDLMNWCLGAEPDYIEATAANRAHPMIEVEDIAEGVIAYHNGAALVSFYVNTFHPYDAPVEMELCCENGRATLTGGRMVIRYADGREESADDSEGERFGCGKDYWGVSHIRQIQAYYEALARGAKPEIDGGEAFKTQRLINGIYESAEKGKRVTYADI